MVALRSMVACVFMLALGLPLTAQSQPSDERVLYIPLATPCRALDTRLTGTPVPANAPTPIEIGGVCGVPATAVGAALNFTITEAQGAGYLTVWSSGAMPLASVVNFVPGEDVANSVDIGLGAGGTVLVQPFATTHLVVDVYGYFTGGELAGSNTALGDSAFSRNITGTNNTALGASALLNNTAGTNNTATGLQSLLSNTTGSDNTAAGFHALFRNITGNFNTATGSRALESNTDGATNTALGAGALFGNTTGSDNTALGVGALFGNTTGVNNTALGASALFDNTTGNSNIAIGIGAGGNVTTGSSNIHVGNVGVDTDAATIRIGNQGVQTSTFIAGISGTTVAGGTQVLVDGDGRLGNLLSSRRVKDDIRDMDEASVGLGKLRPVTFRYKAEPANGSRSIEYGLIAEEVAEIYPELVVLDKDGQPSGVRYHALPAMLLNELQRQQRVIEMQAAQAREQARLIDELTARLSRLEAMGTGAAGR